MLKAVFIDVGNTLLYEKPSRFEIYAEEARRRGREVSSGTMRNLMTRVHRELPREIAGAFRYTDGWFSAYIEHIFHLELGIARGDLASLREDLFGRFSAPGTFSPFPGGRELLERVRSRGLRLGIISNWSTRLPRLLDDLGLSDKVDFVLCSALERAEKPDSVIFERALARAGVAPDEAVHAGDDLEKDYLGARRAGLRAVLVDHAGTQPAGPARVRDLFELDQWIEHLVR